VDPDRAAQSDASAPTRPMTTDLCTAEFLIFLEREPEESPDIATLLGANHLKGISKNSDLGEFVRI
jgi:hypothetical protein